MQACDRCHARKTRCDRRLPSCTACEKAAVACLHRDKLRQRNVPRGYVEGMENKLHALSNENARLKQDLLALRNSRADSQPSRPQALSAGEDTEAGWTQELTAGNRDVPATEQDLREQDERAGSEQQAAELTPDPGGHAIGAEVGFLSLNAAGETRYIGSSSGIGLASIIGYMVDDAGTAAPLMQPATTEPNVNASNDSGGQSPENPVPARHVAMPFIQAYFQHTHITFPLLHQTSFLGLVDEMYRDPDYYTTHAEEAFLFDMVLSIGSSNFNRFGDASAASTAHYSRAHKKLPALLAMPGLTPLRAILLLSQHGIFSNLRDTSASIWHLIGIGVRICYEMGLHLQPRHHASMRDPQAIPTITCEEEMKRRCFWCLYNLDRVVSFTLGRPAAIKDEDVDVALPSPLDDSDFGPEKPVVERPPGGPTTSPFLHLIHIRKLSGQILSAFYTPNQDEITNSREKFALRESFHERIVAWKEDTRLLRLSTASPDGSYKSCFLSPEWYAAVYNNAMLLLYRPSPAFPHPTPASNQHHENADVIHLFSAAKSTIYAYADLHSRRRLNYSWITLHGVFLAGLVYVYCVGRILKDPFRRLPVPNYLDIINDTRACSNVLVAICERWNVFRRSCALFNNLSNAVIRDAVNAVVRVAHEAPSSQRSGADQSFTGDGPWRVDRTPNNNRDYSDEMNWASLTDHIFVADEFRQFSETIDGMFSSNQTFPSELVMGFSQDWPFEEGFDQQPDIGLQGQHPSNSLQR